MIADESHGRNQALEIVWSPLALRRLGEIRAYISNDKPQAAERLATRIISLTESLRKHPFLGRTGTEPGVRELVIAGTPYIVVYRITGQGLVINSVWHGAQQRTVR